MDAFEIGHFGRVAGFHQGLVTGFHQLDEAAAQHGLLAEQVGLAFLLEAGLDDAGPAAADRGAIGQPEIVGIAGNVAVHRQQARHAGAALILRTHGVARPLGRDHHDVEVRARLDQVEVHVEAVGEHDGRALFHVCDEMIAIDVGLQLVGGEHHHDVSPFGGLGYLQDLELFALGLFDALRALAQRHSDLLDAGVAQIERVGMALAAIADDGDLLALDKVQVGITIVINTHGLTPTGARDWARPFVVGKLLGSVGRYDKPGKRLSRRRGP